MLGEGDDDGDPRQRKQRDFGGIPEHFFLLWDMNGGGWRECKCSSHWPGGLDRSAAGYVIQRGIHKKVSDR